MHATFVQKALESLLTNICEQKEHIQVCIFNLHDVNPGLDIHV